MIKLFSICPLAGVGQNWKKFKSLMQKNSKYTVIKKAIKEQVAAGKYKTSALPDRREMAAFFKTSTATCNKAVSELIREGVLKTIRGKGTFQHPDFGKKMRKLHIWIPGLAQPFYVKIAEILTSLAPEYNYSEVTVIPKRWFARSETQILQEQLNDPNADIFMYSLYSTQSLPLILKHPERFVVLRTCDRILDGKVIRGYIQRIEGEQLSVEHLIEKGHRRIMHISTQFTRTLPAGYRDGYRRALEKYNIPFNRHLRFAFAQWDLSDIAGKQKMIDSCIQRYLRFADRPTAVFCHTNEVAVMFLSACIKNNIRVPEELSIASYEGKYMTQFGGYEITTVGPDLDFSLRELMERLSGRKGNGPEDIKFEMHLSEGNTVRDISCKK